MSKKPTGEAIDEIFSSLRWAYTYEMSDYARNSSEEKEFERLGLAQIAKAKAAIRQLLEEQDRATLETLSAVLAGTGGKGKVTSDTVLESAKIYVRNKLEMLEIKSQGGE